MKPTAELYNAMQVAYDHFNDELFDGTLPSVLFTNQRQNGVMGYFAPNRWTSTDGQKCHEIAINPLYVGKSSLIELLQTLVHEMAHCWQECHGKPSNRCYHNKEWANKMVSIGLMPSSTGRPGGSQTGQHMSDYPQPNGRFIYSCEKLLKSKSFSWNWIDRFARNSSPTISFTNAENDDGGSEVIRAISESVEPQMVEQLTISMEHLFGMENLIEQDPESEKKVKSKYTCPKCKINLWGKRGMFVKCGDCEEKLAESIC